MKKVLNYKAEIFIFLSFVFIMGSIIFYGSRLVYYYKLENPKPGEETTNLNEILINSVVYEGEGLRKDSDGYYFFGLEVNNYVSFSGRIYQIISIDSSGNIKMIDNEVETIIYSGNNHEYIDSWLNDRYLNTLNQDYLVKTISCVDIINDSITCSEQEESDISLLTINDYSKAGAQESYLNIGKYFWLYSVNSDGNSWYVDDEGLSNSVNNKVSLGVRPVITLKANLDIVQGDGTLANPYAFEETKLGALNEMYVGSYINYSGYNWKVIENGENTKLIMVDSLDKDGYSSSSNTYEPGTKKTIAYYLNNTFYKSLENKDYVIKNKWYDGVYESDYSTVTSDSATSYVGLPTVGDLVVFGDAYFTMTPTGAATQAIYVVDNSRLTSVDIREEYAVKPIILLDGTINVENGDGTLNNPYIVK